MAINRTIQAGIRGCKNDSHCSGSCKGCNISRTKLLIHTGVIHTRSIKRSQEDEIFTNGFTFSGVSKDSYLNELTEV